MAKENKVNIITSIIEKTDGKPYDAGVVINTEGKILHKYRAKHLFGPIGEKDHYSEGKDAITAFSLDGVKCGLAICYDIRFPEVFRKLAEDGARVIFVVANWPKPKEDIWKTLLKARAMENQVFIIGANRVGKSPDAEYFGKSLIIDPYGSVIKEGSENEEVMESDIDTSMVEDARKKVFYLKDRRV